MPVDNGNAPTGAVRGAVDPQVLPRVSGVASWASFVQAVRQPREEVPELRWPKSNGTYERMLTDSQVWGLYSAMALPAEAYTWWLHPNGNDEGRVSELAEDLGVPMVTDPADLEDESAIERTSLPDEFDFGDLLHEALLAPVFGHYYFEWAFDLIAARYRLRELAPLHPSTLGTIRWRRDGSLEWIQQTGGAGAGFVVLGGTIWAEGPPRITPESLVPFIYWPDASRRWIGRSLLRPLYRNWLCKDVLIRVDVTNHERAGGVPWIQTDERYAGQDLEDLQRLAAEFRVDEEGGAALPPGALLNLARVAGSDTIASIRYHDEAMSFVWGQMVRQLGQTAHGSRALGDTFNTHEVLARRATAEWARRTLNRWVCARWWRWNTGRRNAPVLRFTPPTLEAEVESPPTPQPQPESPVPPEGGGVPPPQAAAARPSPPRVAGRGARREVASAARSREDGGCDGQLGDNQTSAEPHPGPRELGPSRYHGGTESEIRREGHASASADGAAFSRATVPNRQLRREPYPHEVTAAVDFAALDVTYAEAADALDTLFRDEWLPEQLVAIETAITTTRRGTPRVRLTAADMARIRAPAVGAEAMGDLLYDVAARGAQEALAELRVQGLTLDPPDEQTLRRLVTDHAAAVAQQTADGLSLAASRRAVQLTGGGQSPAELARDVVSYVDGLEHSWERDQLSGAAQQAMNAGRFHIFERVDAPAAEVYASEFLDWATCDPCRAVDGRRYIDVNEARSDYPSGGFRECRGGPRCRGTVVVVLASETLPGATEIV